jgi:hypothetical protein
MAGYNDNLRVTTIISGGARDDTVMGPKAEHHPKPVSKKPLICGKVFWFLGRRQEKHMHKPELRFHKKLCNHVHAQNKEDAKRVRPWVPVRVRVGSGPSCINIA